MPINASGSALVYSTYLGGGDADEAVSLAVDKEGNVLVAGRRVLDYGCGSGILALAGLAVPALALAQALQQKKFPAFVITPSAAPGARLKLSETAGNWA